MTDARAVLSYVERTCDRLGVSLRMNMVSTLPDGFVGTYEWESKTITVAALNHSWVTSLLHELGHALEPTTAAANARYWDWISWVHHGRHLDARSATLSRNAVLRSEMFAEAFTIRSMRRFRIPSPAAYTRSANCYLWCISVVHRASVDPGWLWADTDLREGLATTCPSRLLTLEEAKRPPADFVARILAARDG